jgi:hypothetical protein
MHATLERCETMSTFQSTSLDRPRISTSAGLAPRCPAFVAPSAQEAHWGHGPGNLVRGSALGAVESSGPQQHHPRATQPLSSWNQQRPRHRRQTTGRASRARSPSTLVTDRAKAGMVSIIHRLRFLSARLPHFNVCCFWTRVAIPTANVYHRHCHAMPPPTSRPGQYRWQNESKTYASRVGDTTWEQHESRIRSLHADGRTKNEIIEVLHNEHDFKPSYGQLRKRLDRWFSRATRSNPSSSSTTSPIQSGSNVIQTYISSIRRQFDFRDSSPQSHSRLPQDEELVFRTFTTVLDEDGEEARQSSFPDATVKATDLNDQCERLLPRRNGSATQLSPISSRTSATPTTPHATNEAIQSVSGSDINPPTTTPSATNQADPTINIPAFEIAIDFSDDDEVHEAGPMLAGRWSASTDSKEFEELSTQLSCQYPKRLQDLHHNIDPASRQLVRKVHTSRIRYSCCECGKPIHSSKCKACLHKRCEGCQRGPVQS